jgi:hypothetical protein
MARLSLIALIALALTGATQSNPLGQQDLLNGPVHSTEGWEYAFCGQSSVRESLSSSSFNGLLFFLGAGVDVVEIKSIQVTPDPPQPGQNLTVNVIAYAHEVVVVRFLLYLPFFG